jgi:hypothetical protein
LVVYLRRFTIHEWLEFFTDDSFNIVIVSMIQAPCPRQVVSAWANELRNTTQSLKSSALHLDEIQTGMRVIVRVRGSKEIREILETYNWDYSTEDGQQEGSAVAAAGGHAAADSHHHEVGFSDVGAIPSESLRVHSAGCIGVIAVAGIVDHCSWRHPNV